MAFAASILRPIPAHESALLEAVESARCRSGSSPCQCRAEVKRGGPRRAFPTPSGKRRTPRGSFTLSDFDPAPARTKAPLPCPSACGILAQNTVIMIEFIASPSGQGVRFVRFSSQIYRKSTHTISFFNIID
jgi:hypothetical protein